MELCKSVVPVDDVEDLRNEVTKFLSTVERFNVENLPAFEKYVECQVAHNFYDLDANLAVLKLYQLFPQFYCHDVVHMILAKALTNLPHNDFDLCRFLLGGEQFQDLIIQRLCGFANLLETCRFKAFWYEKSNEPGIFDEISGFDDSIRKFISQMIAITYKNMTETDLKSVLGNINDQELQNWITTCNWEKGLHGIVNICSQEDRVAAKDIVEKINVETLSTLMVDIGSVCKSKLTTNEEIANVKEHPKADNMKPLSFKIPDSPSSTRLSIDKEIFTVNPNFDPGHDPDDYETLTEDLTRKPSRETKYDWIYVFNETPYNSKISKGEDIVTGKWLIFELLDKIDDTWEKISTAVANGILGCSAKVSTIKDKETRSPYTDNAVICVYTYDHNDEYDVMRVRGALRRMGFTKKLPYKTDIATLEGEYRWKTGKRVSKYYL